MMNTKQKADALKAEETVAGEILLQIAEEEMDTWRDEAGHWKQEYQRMSAIAKRYWQQCSCHEIMATCDLCREYQSERD